MNNTTLLARLAGRWTGVNRLWLSPAEPARESATTMTVSPAAQSRFATLQYTWAVEGEPQDGLILITNATADDAVEAVWIDSWHMQDKWMLCQGTAVADGSLTVQGVYAAPPGPDWGWQIRILPGADDSFRLQMYNVTPDGEAALAVEAVYTRKDLANS